MDTVLIDQWLPDEESIAVLDEASVSVVRQRVRREGAALGLSQPALGSIVNVASELGHNQLAHARGGRIAIRRIERSATPGIEIVAADRGDGVAAPTDALRAVRRPSWPNARASLGVGLAAVVELADELDFDVRIGEGSCIWARKFARPVARRREVGVYGRPYPGEETSGDDGIFVRSDEDLLVGLADGLGHGSQAREASAAAVKTLRRSALQRIGRILEDCHDALHETRGAVMALARIPEPGDDMQAAAVGNVSLHAYGPANRRHVVGSSFVLGSRGRQPRISVEDHPLGNRDVVVLFSDGIFTRADIGAEVDLLREHPIIIAHQVVDRFARDNDDALVLVAR